MRIWATNIDVDCRTVREEGEHYAKSATCRICGEDLERTDYGAEDDWFHHNIEECCRNLRKRIEALEASR